MHEYTVMCWHFSETDQSLSMIQVQNIIASDEKEAKEIAITRCAEQGKTVTIAPDLPFAKAVIQIR